MKTIFWIALSLVLVTAAHGQSRIYKWVDDQGVVHYTKTPPPNQAAQTMPVDTGEPTIGRAPPAAEQAPPEGPLFAEQEEPDNSKIEAENRRRLCQKGRNMVDQIEPRPRVFRVDEEGNRTYLEDAERLRLLDEARALVRDNC